MRVNLHEAMRRAVEASEQARGRTSPNPPVGAVVLDVAGTIAGVGATQPPGGPHAEVMALREAGERAFGGTLVVTLEPCDHQGRTPPCSKAVIEAGIAQVHYAVDDPMALASGGARTLRRAGVVVTTWHDPSAVARGPLRSWLHRQRTGRPHITYKYAASLDGRCAAEDGSSQWISGSASRARDRLERSRIDAIIVGTGTVLADDPWLTARLPDGSLADHQPARVVVGTRELPPAARVLDDAAPTILVRSREISAVLDALGDRTDVVLEGGPHLAGAFFQAGYIDRITAYVAPMILGAGTPAVVGAGVGNIDQAHRFDCESVEMLGEDVLISLVPR
ncbi:bifunctional diaminohydroxyphosphoribosylaminopyrimidine deaminase/5-amino-6-(5-phosphoribosylamino)uracil reductase RibD [Hoyosella sp. G463]|uniref:Riboflavin biosynthesis protein RibD n=1 Tax=Lolliginicoccus lacisalsi TaxID=2742202 RepID=A0A927PLB7_9ACTN|nr:bifunctional diaminohydroxyphosphoribosylaminopyrimidine deaminase/5-amino-6-(5-phosphoribosylamino)uracil reductase RibD [Lolliginicoccus lacisalsi]MBD8505266.1 bifunctional diaminohydroxyphosphoribosylaminopyrimidine deaminase/5-amino-6-(5-phosphoribosylamino)uracil reductase RibD [Lolliginicoccus lacisalsi]